MEHIEMDVDQASVQTGRTRHTAMSSHNPGLGSMGYFDNADAYVYDATSASTYSMQASGVLVERDVAVGASTMTNSLYHSGIMVDLDRDENAAVMVEGVEDSGINDGDGDESVMVVEGSVEVGKDTEGHGTSYTGTPFDERSLSPNHSKSYPTPNPILTLP